MLAKNMSLKAKIAWGITIPLVLLVLFGIGSGWTTRSLIKTSERVDHTHQAIQNSLEITGSAVDMETGVRGFLLAGKEEFLAPYKEGKKRFKDDIGSLRELVSDNPRQVERLKEAEEIIREWQKEIIEPVIALRREIGDAETMNDMAKRVGEAQGKKYFDKFRGQIKTFISTETALMEERQKKFKAMTDSSRTRLAALDESRRRVEHTYQVIERMDHILVLAVDMETGMRGFLLAGEEEFLEPYNKGRESFLAEIQSLRETVSDNPQQVKRLEQIEILMREWIDKITLPAIALRRQVSEGTKTMEEVNAYVGGKAGKQYFDDFRKRIAAFEKVEKDLQAKRNKIAREAAEGGAANLESMIESNQWVDHTHRVIARAIEIVASAVDMETGMRGYLLAGKEEFLEPYADGEQRFLELAEKLKKTVADNPAQVRLLGEIEETLEGWKEKVTEPAITLRRKIGFAKNMDDMVDRVSEGRGKKYFDAFRKEITNFKAEEESLMEKRKQENRELVNTTDMVSIRGIILALCLGGIISFLIVGNIARAFGKMFKVSEQLLAGNLDVDVSAENTRDETGLLIAAMKEMADNFQMIIGETGKTFGQLAEGNMAVRITAEFPGDFAEIKRVANMMANDFQSVISETGKILGQFSKGDMEVRVTGKFAGDFGKIKNSLESTAKQLGEAKSKNDMEAWLKTGQARLGEQVSGDLKMKQLAENIIDFLTPYAGAQVGAFYLLEKTGEEESLLRMVASHAYVWRKSAADAFKIREGLVGQAAYEQKMFVITQAPEDYVHIKSGLGESAPGAILVTPFIYENELKGVIELASFQRFTDLQLEFLKQAMPVIAIAVNTAESRTKMQDLLEQSQAQSEELQIQQEKMQQTNAMLESQKQEMQVQQEKLQQSNEELHSQSEELQVQQEELRQTNEELELRTRDLEKEREGVRVKNRELEKTQQAIQTKAEELELASKYKSEFLANMSHELRTPLNSLLILAQLLVDNKEENLNEKQIEHARTIYASGVDLLALINEILDLSKVEAGKITIHAEDVSPDSLTKSLQQKFLHIAEKKSLYFDINVAENFPPRLHTDTQRLQQILNNLLSNAFKFTKQGGVTLEMRRPAADEDLSRSGLDPATAVSISVSDTGIGIPKDKQKIVFEAFQQADGTTSRRFGGTGLGLSITRQLVQLLGGEVQLRGEENKGSCFTIYLPERLTAQRTAESAQQTAAETPPVPARKNIETASAAPGEEIEDDRENLNSGDKSLLIIEDDTKFSRILTNLAREKKFKALIATDGKHGLEMAEHYQPSAIILDIGLPQMDGWSVMEKLKDNSDTRHIPVHFVSGADHHADARKMGAIGYSLKPVSMGDLGNAFDKIERFIDNNTLRDVLIVTDNERHRRVISEIVGSSSVEVAVAATPAEAGRHLHGSQCDCIIVDVSVGQNTGVELLVQLCKKEAISQIPVIIYSERDLTQQEDAALDKCASTNDLTVKTVRSSGRLLDETTLFLHQVEAKLPEKQRKMLQLAHDKEAILANRKIILADDDMRNIYALCSVLEGKGIEVIIGKNGEEALKLLDEHKHVDLVLMDIMMPKMDGYEAMQKIRAQARFRKLPIIALTAKAMKEDRTKCIEAGANDYISKPIDSNKLISLMRVWLYQ
ncbi:MAG: response regulator [Gammaproteobacteria bacterium]|nr:response regulator [Gammaproteobacteria bacterium]